MKKIVKLDQDIPKPLEALTEAKIAEENRLLEAAMLEERLRKLEPRLKFKALWTLTRQVNRLKRQLVKADWNAVCQERGELWARYVEQKEHYQKLVERLKTAKTESLIKDYGATKRRLRSIVERGRLLQAQIAALQPIADQFAELNGRLTAHYNAVAFEREEKENEKAFAKEARAYERLLRDVFRGDKRLHFKGTDRKGRPYTVLPRFQKIIITSDTIFYVLQVSRRRFFPPGWVRAIPDDVSVLDLMSDETLKQMSVVLGRQVRVVQGTPDGVIIYAVGRLDTADGLPKLIFYDQVIPHYPVEKHALAPYPLGVSQGGVVEWLSFGECPGLLIGGSPQTGKSNLINCVVSTLISMNSPREVRIGLIDMKGGIEFTHYAGIPHLLFPIVRKSEGIIPALKPLLDILEKRQDMLTAVKQKEILSYNQVVAPERRMARIVIFFDEMATIMGMKEKGEVYNLIMLIAQLGRATGVHVVLCTQYPGANVIPPQIKALIEGRITGALPAGTDSMTITASHSAKKLPPEIRGRLLFSWGANEKFIQAPWLSVQRIAQSVATAMQYEIPPIAAEMDLKPEIAAPTPIELKPKEVDVLTALSSAHGEDYTERRLAAELSMPKTTLHNILIRLADMQLIEKTPNGSRITDQGRFQLRPEARGSDIGHEDGLSELSDGQDGLATSDVALSTKAVLIEDSDENTDIPAQETEPVDVQDESDPDFLPLLDDMEDESEVIYA